MVIQKYNIVRNYLEFFIVEILYTILNKIYLYC